MLQSEYCLASRRSEDECIQADWKEQKLCGAIDRKHDRKVMLTIAPGARPTDVAPEQLV
jgi:hypothetical protein